MVEIDSLPHLEFTSPRISVDDGSTRGEGSGRNSNDSPATSIQGDTDSKNKKKDKKEKKERSTCSSPETTTGLTNHDDEFNIAEAIQRFETELGILDSEKKQVNAYDGLPDTSANVTPILAASDLESSLPLDIRALGACWELMVHQSRPTRPRIYPSVSSMRRTAITSKTEMKVVTHLAVRKSGLEYAG